MFWIISALVVFAATLVVCWPLLRGAGPGWKTLATALLALIPVSALYIYNIAGTPEAIGMPVARPAANQNTAHAGGQNGDKAGDLNTLTENLRARLEENPDDLQGWMLLARSYKTVQRFPEALDALETARQLAPDDPFITVEVVEAQLYVSGKPLITPEMTAQLEAAVEADPSLQKGLWLLGIAASQGGDDARAVEYWKSLQAQLEPGNPIIQSVQTQIDAAKQRLGIEETPEVAQDVNEQAVAEEPGEAVQASIPAVAQDVDQGWSGVTVRVGLDAAANPDSLPANAVLFVIARTPGGMPGPPLGVHRVINPSLPYEFTLNDQHSMTPGRLVSAEPQLELQARLSLTGSPTAAPGDWQSTVHTVETAKAPPGNAVELNLISIGK